MAEADLIEWLQHKLAEFHDEEYETTGGIRIHSYANPGWGVKIALAGTELEDREFETVKREVSDEDWIYCTVRDNEFQGAGGVGNLKEILLIFKTWCEQQGMSPREP